VFSCSVKAAIVVSAVKNKACLCTLISLLISNPVINECVDYVHYMNMKNRESDCEQPLENNVSKKCTIYSFHGDWIQFTILRLAAASGGWRTKELTFRELSLFSSSGNWFSFLMKRKQIILWPLVCSPIEQLKWLIAWETFIECSRSWITNCYYLIYDDYAARNNDFH
jgi:hypothetical protein